jgi:chromosome segregation protein
MKKNILVAQEQQEGLRQRLADESRKLDARNNEHDLLKSLIDSMEGYPESIKFLHKNPAWNQHAPILSDIIYVKEEFRAAVENVLEPYLNYYVVNNLHEGMQAVRLLDTNKKGKANFFLLDKIGDRPPVEVHAHEGLIPAMEVIEVDDTYRGLAEHLLGNVFIAENEEALETSNGAVVLEKTGKFVKGKYSLTGGSVGLFEGKKIGRAKNMEKLQEEIRKQQVVVGGLKSAIQEKHEEVIGYNEQLKEQAIRQTQEDCNRLTNFVFSLQNKIENLHALQESSQGKLEELQLNLEETIANIEDTRNAWSELVRVVADLRRRCRWRRGITGGRKLLITMLRPAIMNSICSWRGSIAGSMD